MMALPTVEASTAAQSIRPVDLSKDSFSSVTPSVSKKRKTILSSSSVVLAEHERSDSCSGRSNDSSVVYVRVKKRPKKNKTTKKMKPKTEPIDLVSSQQPSSAGTAEDDEVTVVDDRAVVVPTVTSEVETQDLPESADFAKASKAQEEEEEVSDNDPMSDLSQNLLEDDDE